MSFSPHEQGQAYNRTRKAFLATKLSLADTHWSRLRGLVGASAREFTDGRGLLIVPCRGVHTLAMRFPIDAIYLSKEQVVVHVERQLKPWRFAPLRMQATTVLELPSGKAVETATEVGDKIEIRLGPDPGPSQDRSEKDDLVIEGFARDSFPKDSLAKKRNELFV